MTSPSRASTVSLWEFQDDRKIVRYRMYFWACKDLNVRTHVRAAVRNSAKRRQRRPFAWVCARVDAIRCLAVAIPRSRRQRMVGTRWISSKEREIEAASEQWVEPFVRDVGTMISRLDGDLRGSTHLVRVVTRKGRNEARSSLPSDRSTPHFWATGSNSGAASVRVGCNSWIGLAGAARVLEEAVRHHSGTDEAQTRLGRFPSFSPTPGRCLRRYCDRATPEGYVAAPRDLRWRFRRCERVLSSRGGRANSGSDPRAAP